MFKSKIHRAVITEADLDYEGSMAIDSVLLEKANIFPFEKVFIWNVTRGTRVETYAIAAPENSGQICVNGAAAHHNKPGDIVIIATFAEVEQQEIQYWTPIVVLVDKENKYLETVCKYPNYKGITI